MTPGTVKEEPANGSIRKAMDSPAVDARETIAAAYAPPSTPEASLDLPSRMPHRIAGGFRGLGEELERHARDWRNAHRLLEQQRPILGAHESERDRLQEALSRLVPNVKDASKALAAGIDAAKKGDISGDLAGHFTRSLATLDELESLAEALTANMLQMRSTWEQYARTVVRAQKLREEIRLPAAERG